MKGLILDTGVEEELVPSTITIIDKIDKLTTEELTNNLLELGLNKTQTQSLLEYFKLSLEELNTKFKETTNEDIKKGLEELNNLEEYINKMNLSEYCTFTSSLARGQDYYTGNVFEVYEKNGALSGAIGGGGRYDKMITEFINDGETYPAVGISFGLTSIFELLKNREEFKDSSPVEIYVIPMGTNIESLKLANDLRNLGIKVDLEMNNKKLKKSLDFCNKENIPYVIILGEDEITNNSFKLKDMLKKEEYIINMNELEKIKDIII
jgi:histidyl-tRNA synthetase